MTWKTPPTTTPYVLPPTSNPTQTRVLWFGPSVHRVLQNQNEDVLPHFCQLALSSASCVHASLTNDVIVQSISMFELLLLRSLHSFHFFILFIICSSASLSSPAMSSQVVALYLISNNLLSSPPPRTVLRFLQFGSRASKAMMFINSKQKVWEPF